MSNTRTQKSQEASFDAFMKQMEVFRGHAAELQAMANDHIGADPDSMLWAPPAHCSIGTPSWPGSPTPTTTAENSPPNRRALPLPPRSGSARRGSGW